jgi:F-type H+-transporting ATPase subunit b
MPGLLASAGSGGGLADINLTLTVSTFIVFLLFAWILKRLAWGPLLSTIEAREKAIREEVEGAARANAEAAQLLEKHKELVRDAGREREELLKRTRSEAEQIRSDLSARARSEADQILERAKEEISRERDAAITALRAQVADVAIEAAAKIVESSLTREAQKKLVDEFVASLEAQRRSERA